MAVATPGAALRAGDGRDDARLEHDLRGVAPMDRGGDALGSGE
jgi:hypothetical protein